MNCAGFCFPTGRASAYRSARTVGNRKIPGRARNLTPLPQICRVFRPRRMTGECNLQNVGCLFMDSQKSGISRKERRAKKEQEETKICESFVFAVELFVG